MSEASVPASAGPGGGAPAGWSGASAEPDPRRWLILIVIAIAQLMVVLDATVMNIALPSAQSALHFNDVDRQWIVTAYSLSFGSLLLFGGRLADLVGRRLMFITVASSTTMSWAIAMTMRISQRRGSGSADPPDQASCAPPPGPAEAGTLASDIPTTNLEGSVPFMVRG